MAQPNICVRLPPDLAGAVDSYAETHNLGRSEVVRMAVYQFVYGTPPDAHEGYGVAKNLAARLAHAAVTVGLSTLPTEVSEVSEYLKQHQALLHSRNRDREG